MTLLRIILCSIATLIIQGSMSEVFAMPATHLSAEASIESHDQNHKEQTPTFEYNNPRLGIGSSTESSQGVTPVARTLHRILRPNYKTWQTDVAVRAIDSTMATPRYGLYNHKILFYAHPRHYYLNGLMRLII